MRTYVVLLRGINVGGKNKVPMAELRACLQERGIDDVRSLIASGNLVVRTNLSATRLQDLVEQALPETFTLDTELVRVLVLTESRFRAMVAAKPAGFGERPDTFHSDAIFLMGITATAAMRVFRPRDGVDVVWPGSGIVYSQRLSAERTKSRLGQIVGTTEYQSMTIRSWNTVQRILAMLDDVA